MSLVINSNDNKRILEERDTHSWLIDKMLHGMTGPILNGPEATAAAIARTLRSGRSPADLSGEPAVKSREVDAWLERRAYQLGDKGLGAEYMSPSPESVPGGAFDPGSGFMPRLPPVVPGALTATQSMQRRPGTLENAMFLYDVVMYGQPTYGQAMTPERQAFRDQLANELEARGTIDPRMLLEELKGAARTAFADSGGEARLYATPVPDFLNRAISSMSGTPGTLDSAKELDRQRSYASTFGPLASIFSGLKMNERELADYWARNDVSGARFDEGTMRAITERANGDPNAMVPTSSTPFNLADLSVALRQNAPSIKGYDGTDIPLPDALRMAAASMTGDPMTPTGPDAPPIRKERSGPTDMRPGAYPLRRGPERYMNLRQLINAGAAGSSTGYMPTYGPENSWETSIQETPMSPYQRAMVRNYGPKFATEDDLQTYLRSMSTNPITDPVEFVRLMTGDQRRQDELTGGEVVLNYAGQILSWALPYAIARAVPGLAINGAKAIGRAAANITAGHASKTAVTRSAQAASSMAGRIASYLGRPDNAGKMLQTFRDVGFGAFSEILEEVPAMGVQAGSKMQAGSSPEAAWMETARENLIGLVQQAYDVFDPEAPIDQRIIGATTLAMVMLGANEARLSAKDALRRIATDRVWQTQGLTLEPKQLERLYEAAKIIRKGGIPEQIQQQFGERVDQFVETLRQKILNPESPAPDINAERIERGETPGSYGVPIGTETATPPLPVAPDDASTSTSPIMPGGATVDTPTGQYPAPEPPPAPSRPKITSGPTSPIRPGGATVDMPTGQYPVPPGTTDPSPGPTPEPAPEPTPEPAPEPAPEPVPDDANPPENEPTPERRLANMVWREVRNNRLWGPEGVTGEFPKWQTLSLDRMADEAFGGTMASGRYSPSQMWDAMEAGVNRFLARNDEGITWGSQRGIDKGRVLDYLLNLERSMPTITVRDQTKNDAQQFSTPWSYAYALVHGFGQNLAGKKAWEPSAGTGNLATIGKLVGLDVSTNEWEGPEANVRADLLDWNGFTVTRSNATTNLPDRKNTYDVVFMNPPFSNSLLSGEKGDSRIVLGHLTEGMRSLKPGGRLIAIVSDGTNYRRFKAEFDAMAADFGFHLSHEITVPRDVYKKMGTTYPTRVLVMDRKDPGPLASPKFINITGNDYYANGKPQPLFELMSKMGQIGKEYEQGKSAQQPNRPPGGEPAPPGNPPGNGPNTNPPEGPGENPPPTDRPPTTDDGMGPVSGGNGGGGAGTSSGSSGGGGRSGGGGSSGGGRTNTSGGSRGGGSFGGSTTPGTSTPSNGPSAPGDGGGDGGGSGLGGGGQTQGDTGGSESGGGGGPAGGGTSGGPSTGGQPGAPGTTSGGGGGEASGGGGSTSTPGTDTSDGGGGGIPLDAAPPQTDSEAMANVNESIEAINSLLDQFPDDFILEATVDVDEGIDGGGDTWLSTANAPSADIGSQTRMRLAKMALDLIAAKQVNSFGQFMEFVETTNPTWLTKIRESAFKQAWIVARPQDEALLNADADSGVLDWTEMDLPFMIDVTEGGSNFLDYLPEHPGIAAAHISRLIETKSLGTTKGPLRFWGRQVVETLLQPIKHMLDQSLKTRKPGEPSGISIAQAEPVAQALFWPTRRLASGHRMGTMLGDGMGVGKGREITAFLEANYKSGVKRMIWLSVNDNKLYEAAKDDVRESMASFPLHTMNDSNVRGKDGIKIKEGCIVCSYTKLSQESRNNNKSAYQAILEWANAVDGEVAIVFDESHKGKNVGDTLPDGKIDRDSGSKMAAAMVNLQAEIPNARVMYASATGMGNADEMGYMTRLGIWGEGTAFATFNDFASWVREGGVPAMEMVAREMKALGRYVSRFLPFEHPNGEQLTSREMVIEMSPEARKHADSSAAVWRNVMHTVLNSIDTSNAKGERKKDFSAQFTSAMMRYFQQLYTSIKASAVLDAAEQDIANGKQVVIAMDRTNRAAETAAIKAGGEDVSDIDITGAGYLIRLIEDAFNTQLAEIVEETTPSGAQVKVTKWVWVDENGRTVRTESTTPPPAPGQWRPVQDPALERAKEIALAEAEKLQVFTNPLDMIYDRFGADAIAEVSGRGYRLEVGDDGRRVKKVLPKSEVAIKEFQEGKRQLAIISAAGAEGISLHASERAGSKVQRVYYALQIGFQTKAEFQKLYRVHRAGQVIGPEYVFPRIDIPADARFVMAVASRLTKMMALTRGDRNAASMSEIEAYDMDNDYARRALNKIVSLMRGTRHKGLDAVGEEMVRLGALIRIDDAVRTAESNRRRKFDDRDGWEVTPEKFYNRLMLLAPADQKVIIDLMQGFVDQQVEAARIAGVASDKMRSLEANDLTITKAPIPFYTDEDSGAQSYYVEVRGTEKTTYRSWEQAVAMWGIDGTNGFTPYFTYNSSGVPILVYDRRSDGSGGNRLSFISARSQSPSSASGPQAAEIEGRRRINGLENAKKEWTQHQVGLPKEKSVTRHIVTGVVTRALRGLASWDLNALSREAVRVEVAHGNRKAVFTGVEIPSHILARVKMTIGIGDEGIMNGADAFDALTARANFTSAVYLDGGLALVRRNVRGAPAIAVVHVKRSLTHSDRIDREKLRPSVARWAEAAGVITLPDGQFESFYAVPNDTELGPEVIDRLIARYPIVATADKDYLKHLDETSGQADGDDLSTAWENDENDVDPSVGGDTDQKLSVPIGRKARARRLTGTLRGVMYADHNSPLWGNKAFQGALPSLIRKWARIASVMLTATHSSDRKEVFGFWSRRQRYISLRNSTDMVTAAHEMAHMLDERHEITKKLGSIKDGPVRASFQALSRQRKLNREVLAEFMERFVSEPNVAASPAAQWLKGILSPEANEFIQMVRRDVLSYLDADPVSQASAGVAFDLADARAQGMSRGLVARVRNWVIALKDLNNDRSIHGGYRTSAVVKMKNLFDERMSFENAVLKVFTKMAGKTPPGQRSQIREDIDPSLNPLVPMRELPYIPERVATLWTKGIHEPVAGHRIVPPLKNIMAPLSQNLDERKTEFREAVILQQSLRILDTWDNKVEKINELVEAKTVEMETVYDATLRAGMVPLYSKQEIDLIIKDYKEQLMGQAQQEMANLLPDGGIDIDVVARAQEIVKRLNDDLRETDPERVRRMRDFMDNYVLLADWVVREAKRTGLISQEDYASIMSTGVHYVSFAREMTDTDENGYALPYFDVAAQIIGSERRLDNPDRVIHSLEGSKRMMKDPLTALIQNVIAVMYAGKQNEVMSRFASLIMSTDPLNPYDTNSEIGVVHAPGQYPNNPEAGLWFRLHGKKVCMEVSDQHVRDAIRAVHAQSNLFQKVLDAVPGIFTRFQQTMITKEPGFQARNIIRDTITLFTQGRDHGGLGDLVKSFTSETPWQYGWYGAGIGVSNSGRGYESAEKLRLRIMLEDANYEAPAYIKGYRLFVRKLGDTMDRIEKGERVNRITVLRKAAERLMKEHPDWQVDDVWRYAAYEARATMTDFKVTGQVLRAARPFVPFIGAQINSATEFARAMRRNPRSAFTRMLILTIVMRAAEEAWAEATNTLDLIRGADPRSRDFFANFYVPQAPGWSIAVPVGHAPAAMSAVLRQAYAYTKGDEGAFYGVMSSVMSALSPMGASLIDSAASPMLEVLFHRDMFRDRPIVPENERRVVNEGRRNQKYASALGHFIKDFAPFRMVLKYSLGVDDARQVDHLVRGYLGAYGRALIEVSNAWRPDPESGEWRFNGVRGKGAAALAGFAGLPRYFQVYGARDVQETMAMAAMYDIKSLPFDDLMDQFYAARDAGDDALAYEAIAKILIVAKSARKATNNVIISEEFKRRTYEDRQDMIKEALAEVNNDE